MMQIKTFGEMTLRANGAFFLISGLSRSLLGLLIMRRAAPAARAAIAEQIWGETSGRQARRRLSTALWRLKKALPPTQRDLFIETQDTLALRLRWSTWIDCFALDRRITCLLRSKPEEMESSGIARLERCLDLYRGDFLSGVDEEWALIERIRFRDLATDGMLHLTQALAAKGRWSDALAWGRRALAHEPLREEVHRLLMRAHLAMGNRALALAQYDECRRLLHRELGVRPMAETRQLFASINEPSGSPIASEDGRNGAANTPGDHPITEQLSAGGAAGSTRINTVAAHIHLEQAKAALKRLDSELTSALALFMQCAQRDDPRR